MGEICPSCSQLTDIVHFEKSRNITVTTYSCGDKKIDIISEIVEPFLGIKVKDQTGKVLVESKIEDKTEKRISRKPSRAIQLVLKEGRIVHLHCKSEDCGNEWKIKEGSDWSQKFDAKQGQSGIWTIICKKCGRSYHSG